jgi:hypothetical protein
MVKPKIEAYWATARQEVFQQCDHESPRFYFAGLVLKYSPFSLHEIMGAPKLRLHRQALARMLTGDMMIGRITRHYFLPTADRVPGLPTGCVTCYKSSGAIVREPESEEHLLFDCCTTSRFRSKIWSALTESEAQRLLRNPPGSRLEALLSSNRLELWNTLGEVFFKIWCRPQQAWRAHHADRNWKHTG